MYPLAPLLPLLLLLVSFSSTPSADNTPLPMDITQWQEHIFKGKTHYQNRQEDGEKIIQANSKNGASALYLQRDIDLTKTPILRWHWRISNTLGNIEEQTKAGDDYPARVYVVLKQGLFGWSTKAVNYVWSSSQTKGSRWTNAYTENARMIALRSGDEQAGEWRQEARDIREDFRQLFGIEVDAINGIALMTDTDNSGKHAEAWYRGFEFVAE